MDYKKELDRVYSLYIRLRDADSNGMIRCISCGRSVPYNRADNGHFFSRRHIATRWDEDNCHAQCIECNRMRYGNIDAYRERLIAKIGQKAFDDLEARHRVIEHEPDEETYRELIAGYKVCCEKLMARVSIIN